MNDIIPTTSDGSVTMSSREIAELVNSRHDKVKQSIERLAERGVIQLPPMGDVKNHLGQTVQEYRIGKRDSYVIVAQLSPEFTARLVDRWQELETQTILSAFNIPKSYAEALRLAAGQAETIEQQQVLIADLTPKAEFHDDVANAINAQTFMDVAKILGTGRTRFTQWLRGRSILMENNRPYQRYLDDKYFRVVEKRRKDPMTGEMITYPQTLITGKGVTYLHKKWIADHSPEGEASIQNYAEGMAA